MQTLGEVLDAYAAERTLLGPTYLQENGEGAALLLAIFGIKESE